MPQQPYVTQLLIAVWVIFIVYAAWKARRDGLVGVLNQGMGFTAAMLFGVTIATSLVWDWAPTQSTRRISNSSGIKIAEQLAGGMVQLVAPTGSVLNFPVTIEIVGQPTATGTPLPPPAVINTPVPPAPVDVRQWVYPITEVSVLGLKVDQLVLEWADGGGVSRVIPKGQISNARVCGVWLKPGFYQNDTYTHVVACNGDGRLEILRADQLTLPPDFPWPAATPTAVPPTQVPTIPPGMATAQAIQQLQELQYARGACWVIWATQVNLRESTEQLGALVLPFGTNWKLTGPGGFLEFGSWTTEANEVWHLSSSDLGITDFLVTGALARSFPDANDSETITVIGQGPMCP